MPYSDVPILMEVFSLYTPNQTRPSELQDSQKEMKCSFVLLKLYPRH